MAESRLPFVKWHYEKRARSRFSRNFDKSKINNLPTVDGPSIMSGSLSKQNGGSDGEERTVSIAPEDHEEHDELPFG